MPVPEYIRRLRAKIGHDLLMIPGAAAIVANEAGEVLLHRRGDNGLWSLPGGVIEPGEEPAEAVIREVYEETGLHVLPERIVGIYGGQSNMSEYPNGDKAAFISVTFKCRVVGGSLRIDGDESLELRYFDWRNLPENMMDRHRIRIEHSMTRSEPYFSLPG
ncbi:MAG TPA: NUDIX domain-containing protein [Spirillospora sp.]|nr:NUDIX domain-containing protein [Spirillospora sp.]